MSDTAFCNFARRVRYASSTRLLASAACLVSLACSASSDLEQGSTTSSLIGGALSPKERDAVVFIRGNFESGVFNDCSGTLVSPRVVITAKHCVSVVQPGEFVCSGAGRLTENGNGAGLFGAKLDAERVEIHTGAAPTGPPAARATAFFATASLDACHDDIAAIVLDTPLSAPSYPPLRGSRATLLGETVKLVGYGHGGGEPIVERREIDDVRVIDVGGEDALSNPSATTPSRSFAVAGGNACFGDSGGPALSMATGALVGVYSRISGDCLARESRNTFMLSAGFAQLFAEAFEFAGENPRQELVDPGSSGSAGASAETPTPESTRHDAFQCSLTLAHVRSTPWLAAWLLGLAAVGLSRRRFGRGPSGAG
jgi:hypothetical protein